MLTHRVISYNVFIVQYIVEFIVSVYVQGAAIVLAPPLQHNYVVERVLVLFSHPVRLKSVLILRRRRLLKYGPSVYVVKCRFSMNSLSVPFGRRSLWTPPYYVVCTRL